MSGSAGELASFVFFGYCAALGFAQDPHRRSRVLLGSAAGLLVCGGWVASARFPILHDWILPPIVLLAAYWTSGALFTSPSLGAEARLLGLDRALRIGTVAARAPRAVAESLETAYVFVYPLIPVSLALHLAATPNPDVDRFWGVILVTDYICFGTLPWVQTRPPRLLGCPRPWRSTVRRLNLKLLGRTSIGVNTFPSGHAAEALAAALLVTGAAVPIVLGMWTAALMISAGAVLGRYHYAADAIAGWAVAIAVWALL